VKDGNPDLEALATHGKVPNIACCKLEQWPKRTYMRYKDSILTFVNRICNDPVKTDTTYGVVTCQAGSAI